MPNAISNTSPLLYLHRVGVIQWLPKLFDEVWIPQAVVEELREGQRRGYVVPNPDDHSWLQIINATNTPSEWLALDLGSGELAAMALALENSHCVVLLDDRLARRTAEAAELTVWGTLKVLLEAKAQGLTESIGPPLEQLESVGMWLSDEIRQRILVLANEDQPS